MSENKQDSDVPEGGLKDAGGLFLRGLAMGAADVVPGVSGGTIAFITGIYERFINALTSLSPAFILSLFKGQLGESFEQFKAFHWRLLIPLGMGVAVAVVTLSKLITGLMVDAPGPTYAFFFGLILASIYLPFARMHTRQMGQFAMLAVAAVCAWLVVGLQPDGLEAQVARKDVNPTAVFYAGKVRQVADVSAMATLRDTEAAGTPLAVFDPKGVLAKAGFKAAKGDRIFTDKAALYTWLETAPALVVLKETRAPLWWIFLCGLIAISAMVLPGLSGSFLLLFLGQYHAVFSGLHQCIGHALGWVGRDPNPMMALTAHAWLSDFLFVGTFGFGVLIGLATFSRIVRWLFESAHDLTLAALAGLMLGALRLPGDMIIGEINGGHTSWGIVLVLAVIGAVGVGILSWIDQRRVSASSA
jgi:uncharacterized membrane protein